MANRTNILKENMRRACLIYLEKQAEQLPSEEKLKAGHVFSEHFSKRMYDAMHPRSFYRAAPWKRARRMSVRSLVAVALFICVLISGAGLVPAILMQKPASAAMVVEQYPSEKNLHIKCKRNPWAVLGSPTRIEEVNLPTYIPEGYEQLEGELQLFTETARNAYIQTDSINDKTKELIIYSQHPLITKLDIDLGKISADNLNHVSVNSNNGVICQRADNGYWNLYWNDGSYLYMLSGKAGEVSQEELIQMAESVQKVYNAPVQ